MLTNNFCGQCICPSMMPQSVSEESTTMHFALLLHSIATHLFNATNPMTFPNIHGASLAIGKHNSWQRCMLHDAANGYLFKTQPPKFCSVYQEDKNTCS